MFIVPPERELVLEYIAGALTGFAELLAGIRDWFWETGESIDDVWLLGDWLAMPFYAVGWFFDTAEFVINAFRDLLVRIIEELFEIQDAVAEWFDWTALIEQFNLLIANAALWIESIVTGWWPGLLYLFSWPLRFITETLIDELPQLDDLFNWPGVWLRLRIREHFPWIEGLLDDPLGWLWDWLVGAWEHLGELFESPLTWLDSWLDYLIPDWRAFSLDPSRWLDDLLAGLWPEWSDFKIDPIGWIVEQLLSLLEMQYERLHERIYGLAEHVLRFMWEGIW